MTGSSSTACLALGYEFGDNKIRWTNFFVRDTIKQTRLGLGNRQETTTQFMQQDTAWFARQLFDTQIVGEFKLADGVNLDLRGTYRQFEAQGAGRTVDRICPHQCRCGSLRRVLHQRAQQRQPRQCRDQLLGAQRKAVGGQRRSFLAGYAGYHAVCRRRLFEHQAHQLAARFPVQRAELDARLCRTAPSRSAAAAKHHQRLQYRADRAQRRQSGLPGAAAELGGLRQGQFPDHRCNQPRCRCAL